MWIFIILIGVNLFFYFVDFELILWLRWLLEYGRSDVFDWFGSLYFFFLGSLVNILKIFGCEKF